MKAAMHDNKVIISADDDWHERIFLQDLNGKIVVNEGNWLERIYTFEYNKNTRSIMITKIKKEND